MARKRTKAPTLEELGRSDDKKAARAAAATAARRHARHAAKLTAAAVPADTVFDELTAAVQASSPGGGIMTSAQAEATISGLPLPSLSLAMLLQQDVLALSRLLMIVGLEGTCKSALLAELYRWFVVQPGMAVHIETENKDSPDLRNSILWNDPVLTGRVKYDPKVNQQGWMRALVNWFIKGEAKFARSRWVSERGKEETAADYKARQARAVNKDAPGWIYPIIYGVDSLTATSAAATIENIRATGAPERRYQLEAMLLSDFAKTLPMFMRDRPFLLATVNHLKPGSKDDGAPSDNIPGGRAFRFMNTTEFKVVRMGHVKRAEYSAVRVLISAIKNALGESDLRLPVTFKWWWEYDEEADQPIQRTVWDWDAATMEALRMVKARSAKQWNGVNEVVDLHFSDSGAKTGGGTVWSQALGIPSASPEELSTAGAALEARPDLVAALYRPLHIRRRTRFSPGVDYADFSEHLRRMADRTEPIYRHRDAGDTSFIDADLLAEIAAKSAAPEDDDE